MPRAWYLKDKTREIAKWLVTFFGLLGVLWFLSTISWLSPVFRGIQSGLYATATSIEQIFTRIFASEESLTRQLTTCKDQLAEQSTRATALASADDEAAQWRSLFGYTSSGNIPGVPSRVIARGSFASSDILIDKGSNDSIAIGSAVVIGNGQLFGVVTKVDATQSIIRLIEDAQSAIPAQVLGQDKTIGLVTGNEGAALTMEYIPQDVKLSVGDGVLTSGLGGTIPAGLFIGTVTEVSQDLSEPFQSATITPSHDARAWTVVLVLPVASPL